MKSLTRSFIVVSLAAAFLAAGCSHKSAGDITGQLAAFDRMRDQAVENSAAAKTSLDPNSLHQMAICYSDLRVKATQYTDHIVAIIQSASFDSSQNQADQQQLQASIASYNDCLLKLQKLASTKNPAPAMALLGADWVPSFGAAVDAYWARDGALVTALSPADKAQLIEQIRSLAAWPEFANVGGGSPAPPPPHSR